MESNPYATPSTASWPAAKDRKPGHPPLASRWLRFAGSLIDGLILVVPLLLIVFNLGPLLEQALAEVSSVAMQEIIIEVGAAVSVFVLWVLINVWTIASNGQTLGKVMVGTKVVRDDGSAIAGTRYIFLRFLPFFLLSNIPVIGTLISLADAVVIFRENRKCLHDELAGTIVINAR